MILPCGCEMWRDGRAFKIIPCHPECPSLCPNYNYAIKESEKRGNRIIQTTDANEKY